ncbi:MAG TPA: carboxypeptidase-like regulatory domain-containing protein, partial [Agriterribacter sp.]|nr:carboxypeptidase-like regulatory domain-containing protein [Agriterribacter sp.]
MIKLFKNAAIAVLSLFFTFTAAGQNNNNSETIAFKVSGACGMCQQRIEKAAGIKGVRSAQWNVHTQMLTLTYQPSVVDPEKIHTRIAAVGHDTELKKATDKAYNALPECCLYRDMEPEATAAAPQSGGPAITGVVLAEDNKGNFTALAGATIAWLDTHNSTVSDKHGVFSLPLSETNSLLVISYAGYRPDTLTITDNSALHVVLASDRQLNTITLTARRKSVLVNTSSAFRTTTITSRELMKAACCNLSESFETNPSVDVSYSDAVTGSKQIQLLGLSGNYTQLTVENLPGPRGIATPLGLNSIVGPWIESIQMSKGTGSVVNGFESIAGQINVELKKPDNTDRLYANGYINSIGRSDINLNLSQQMGSKWSAGLLLHDNFLYTKSDLNKDGFRDLPTGNLFSAINRWKYDDNKGWTVQFGVKILADDRTGGETAYSSGNKFSTDHYGIGIKTNRYEGFAQVGYVFP